MVGVWVFFDLSSNAVRRRRVKMGRRGEVRQFVKRELRGVAFCVVLDWVG